MDKVKQWGPLIGVLIIGAVLWAWNLPKDKADGEYHEATQDSRVDGVDTEKVNPKDGVVVKKPEAKDKLRLPPHIKQDDAKHVVDAVVVGPGEKRTSVVTILDENTGETTTLEQRLATPWLAAEQRGQVWFGYGFKNDGRKAFRIGVEEDLVQVKALHLGLRGSIDTDGDYYAMVVVSYRW